MFPIKSLIERFGEILGEMDALANGCGDEGAEDLEELNAELEDALLLLSEAKPEDEDFPEELEDALEELRALAADYRALAAGIEGLSELAERLEMAVELAEGSVKA